MTDVVVRHVVQRRLPERLDSPDGFFRRGRIGIDGDRAAATNESIGSQQGPGAQGHQRRHRGRSGEGCQADWSREAGGCLALRQLPEPLLQTHRRLHVQQFQTQPFVFGDHLQPEPFHGFAGGHHFPADFQTQRVVGRQRRCFAHVLLELFDLFFVEVHEASFPRRSRGSVPDAVSPSVSLSVFLSAWRAR